MKGVIKLAYSFLGEEHSRKKEKFPKEPCQEGALLCQKSQGAREATVNEQCGEG